MISSVRTSGHPSSPSSTNSPAGQGTIKSRRSSSRLASPRFAKNIDVFDFSALQDKLPPNTGPAGVTPVTSGAGNSTNANKNLSHVPCKFFKQGICQAGSSCPFSHNLEGTLSSDKLPCKYFQKGNCRFGMKCALAHILPDGTRVNARASMTNRRGSDRNDRSRSRSDSSLKVGHLMGFSMAEGSNFTAVNPSSSQGFFIDTLSMNHQRNGDNAFASSPTNLISHSTSAFLRDQNYFDDQNSAKLGSFYQERSVMNGSQVNASQVNGDGYNGIEWPYRRNSGWNEPVYAENGDVPHTGGFLAASNLSINSLPVLFMSSGSPKSSVPKASAFPFHSSPQSSGLPSTSNLAQANFTPNTSPTLNYNTTLYEDCAVDDDEEEGDFDNTLFEDYIPGSLGNIIFTPQEKRRRDSRSQSGTLLVRPDVYSDSQAEKRPGLPMVANGAYKPAGEVFLMD